MSFKLYRNLSHALMFGCLSFIASGAYASNNLLMADCFVTVLPSNSSMYPGESMFNANGYPSLVKFVKGDSKKPLVVFIPGNLHLGRISYGFPGGNDKDFLAYWLNKEGYSFLSISYPLEHPVYPGDYSQFTLEDFGKQVAQITQYYIQQEKLNNSVIVLLWSGAGRSIVNINREMKNSKINLDFAVSLDASPPLMGINATNTPNVSGKFPINSSGYLDKNVLTTFTTDQVHGENKLNGKVIIPDNIYESQFMASSPVQFYNNFIKYNGSKLVTDESGMLKNNYYQNFADYPLVAVIHDDDQLDAFHVVLDSSNWNFINEQALYSKYLNLSYEHLTNKQWLGLQSIYASIPSALTRVIHGNHWFFIGENGARQTAQAIQEEEQSVHKIKQELTNPAYNNDEGIFTRIK